MNLKIKTFMLGTTLFTLLALSLLVSPAQVAVTLAESISSAEIPFILDGGGTGDTVFSVSATHVGKGSGHGIVTIKGGSAEINRPTLDIINEGTQGNAASIRMKGPSPQIEFFEIDQYDRSPYHGKWEIQGQGGDLRINRRTVENDR